jgi:hypothetical protein
MTNLSPATQTVAEAYWRMPVPNTQNHQLAAALRAAADQVVPENTGISYTKQDIRAALLAIADELEGQ